MPWRVQPIRRSWHAELRMVSMVSPNRCRIAVTPACPALKARDAMSVVVITGASRGIGAATARLAAERGHDVCVNFRANEAAAGAIVAEVLALGQRAVAVQADVARASKAALEAQTIGLSKEVAGEGIRVNAVRAGIIDTGIHASGGEPGRVARLGPQLPMGRGGQATEVARAILWLLSDEASYTTGTFIDVAGGR